MHKSGKGHEKYNVPLWFVNTRHAVYFLLGVIEVLLGFRFIFKLLGANPQNGFVAFIYSMSGIFSAPFSGIFDSLVSPGLAAKSVFEPAAIIGMIVYAVIAWGIISLIRIKANNRE
jgi:hypothetical protein